MMQVFRLLHAFPHASLEVPLSWLQEEMIPNISEFPKISMIWKSIPSQLARENKKFIYKVVKEGARAREYEDALQWLVDARLVHKIYRSTAPGLPVAAYDDISAFKIYLVDVGLLRRLAQLAPTAFGEGNRLFTDGFGYQLGGEIDIIFIRIHVDTGFKRHSFQIPVIPPICILWAIP